MSWYDKQPGSYRGTVVAEMFQRQNQFNTEFLLRLTFRESLCSGQDSGIPKKHTKQVVICQSLKVKCVKF